MQPSLEQVGIINQMERLIRRDPACRGLLSDPDIDAIFPLGQLALAAQDLVQNGHAAWIVTGFFIPRSVPPAAESDGPLGALLLASILNHLNIRVELLTDPRCTSLLQATAELFNLPRSLVREIPDSQLPGILQKPPPDLTHLIAIERVGPSHTIDSLVSQNREAEPPLAEFERAVPPSAQNHCHNMRGEIIDSYTGSLHQLFDLLPQANHSLQTIGVGDGGNEIGMGQIPWEKLASRLAITTSQKIICRIATDWNIVAGTSNWGGYALAAAVALLKNRIDLLAPFTTSQQSDVLSKLVESRLAVDGVTREFQPTVDGLPFLTYIQPWTSIRKLLNLED